MGYVEENLLPGEEVVYRARLHWIVYSAPVMILILGLLIEAGAFVVGRASEPSAFGPRTLKLARSAANNLATPTPTGSSTGPAVNCGLVFIAAAAVLTLARSIALRTSEFAVTTKRVLIKIGWLRRHSLELLLGKIEGIGVDQGIVGRWLGYGTITVGGTGGTKERFQSIANPLEFRRQVQARIPS